MISKLKTNKVVGRIVKYIPATLFLLGFGCLVMVVFSVFIYVRKSDLQNQEQKAEMKRETHREWNKNMGYDFSYESWKELKKNESLPTIPNNDK